VVADRDQVLPGPACRFFVAALIGLARGRARDHAGVGVELPAGAAAVDEAGERIGDAVVDESPLDRRRRLAARAAGGDGLADASSAMRRNASSVRRPTSARVLEPERQVAGDDGGGAAMRAGELNAAPALAGAGGVDGVRAAVYGANATASCSAGIAGRAAARIVLDVAQLRGLVGGGADGAALERLADLDAQRFAACW
jgi:hypothetical protein